MEFPGDFVLYGDPPDYLDGLVHIFRSKAESFSKSGAIPKASVSDDEIAFIKLLRNLPIPQSIRLFKLAMTVYETDPDVPKDGYTDQFYKRVKGIVEKGSWEIGVDFEGLLWFYDSIEKRKKAIKGHK